MPAPLSIKIDVQVVTDRRPGLEQRIARGLEVGAREATQEYLDALEERIISQNIPGPDLAEVTIKIKRERGGQFPESKWLFEDIAIARAQIITEGSPNEAQAHIIAPPERPFSVYHLLEYGGINESENVVPARPLFTTVAEQEPGRIQAAFQRGFYSGSGESP